MKGCVKLNWTLIRQCFIQTRYRGELLLQNLRIPPNNSCKRAKQGRSVCFLPSPPFIAPRSLGVWIKHWCYRAYFLRTVAYRPMLVKPILLFSSAASNFTTLGSLIKHSLRWTLIYRWNEKWKSATSDRPNVSELLKVGSKAYWFWNFQTVESHRFLHKNITYRLLYRYCCCRLLNIVLQYTRYYQVDVLILIVTFLMLNCFSLSYRCFSVMSISCWLCWKIMFAFGCSKPTKYVISRSKNKSYSRWDRCTLPHPLHLRRSTCSRMKLWDQPLPFDPLLTASAAYGHGHCGN
jgi:hypothetical protein